ncbi:hypothetical protein FQA39_LY17151 [Lamprigera yunnana]|nr:hypothetical protein FQA39_LY17151 [Lamprigera yunnana]
MDDYQKELIAIMEGRLEILEKETHKIKLSVKFRYLKVVVNLLNKFQVSCTYDEVLRFKESAAHEESKKYGLSEISVVDTSETFTVIDNFDTEISSQNVKMTTHSLAVRVSPTKPESESLVSGTHKSPSKD